MISQILPFLFILITLCLKNQVLSLPVLLWSNQNLPRPAVSLSALSPLDLVNNYICTLTDEQIELRIIAVNDLTIEYIQQDSQRNNPIFLDAKKDKTKFRYFPNVANDVYKTLSLIPQSNNMKCSQIHFVLKSSKIYAALPDALDTMQAMIHKVEKNSNKAVVIALVNAPADSEKLARERRQASLTNNTVQVLTSTNKTCMFHANQLYWNDVNGTKSSGRIYNPDLNSSSCTVNMSTSGDNNSSVTLEVVWKNNITQTDTVSMSLIATIIGRYWYLEKAILNKTEYRYFAYGMHSRMDTPPKFSYVCTTAIFIRYNSSGFGVYNFSDKFYLTNLQFQPFYANGSYFGPPNYCTSFFTSGIWMAITSSLLCLAILLFGVHRMMTIKSNDRFDDPKGKPLIIKAQE